MGTPAAAPLVGISLDLRVHEDREIAQAALAYAACVERAGGVPVCLPPLPEMAPRHARLCRAFVLTGGGDPTMEDFGVPTHALAKPMHPKRQAYELALLRAIDETRPAPCVLGICLGMQLMALHAGGRLEQHLPDVLPTHGQHRAGSHRIAPVAHAPAWMKPGVAASNHHQGVADAGGLRVIARGDDGLIEAIDDPGRPFYLGVQWHPERTSDPGLGQAAFDALIEHARR